MKNLFEGIAALFENVLFAPLSVLRSVELKNWWVANGMTWLFVLIGFVALVYWIQQLRGFDKTGEENKDPSAHSFL
jgi:hypothetical protein